jgi:hypothetical protein
MPYHAVDSPADAFCGDGLFIFYPPSLKVARALGTPRLVTKDGHALRVLVPTSFDWKTLISFDGNEKRSSASDTFSFIQLMGRSAEPDYSCLQN